MACGCTNRQRALVQFLCRHGMTKLCAKAKERLAKMEAKEK